MCCLIWGRCSSSESCPQLAEGKIGEKRKTIIGKIEKSLRRYGRRSSSKLAHLAEGKTKEKEKKWKTQKRRRFSRGCVGAVVHLRVLPTFQMQFDRRGKCGENRRKIGNLIGKIEKRGRYSRGVCGGGGPPPPIQSCLTAPPAPT